MTTTVTCPDGHELTHELDTVSTNAEIDEITVNSDGTLEIEWGGYSEVIWDTQVPDLVNDERQFLCAENGIFLESQLVKVPVREEEE
jgi:hypothetical protein